MQNKQTEAWSALESHRDKILQTPIKDLVAQDPGRFDGFSLKLQGLLIDYSRQHINTETLSLLQDLARECDVESWRDKMFSGGAINESENRAVLHTALRRPKSDTVIVDGHNIMPNIHATFDRMKTFTESIHTGEWTGYGGKKIKSIVNIGIGGSDLGPRMVVEALHRFKEPSLRVYFVSNVDGADLFNTLQGLDPEETLFLIASKTFTTQETMANATTARLWITKHFKNNDAIARHFVALSTNIPMVKAFGIDENAIFPFSDWVGGRFSLWSSIGLSIALAVGFDNFRTLLDGACAMDRHFQSAPAHENAPIMMALLGAWNRSILKRPSLAVLPYARNLALFSAWLQQTDMESNGKHITREGTHTTHDTAPVVFGTAGTDCQHSYFQMIHQGTDIIPCDFIATIKPDHPHPDDGAPDHHKMLLANLVAQAEALMQGRSVEDSGNDPQRSFDGNRPSTILMMDQLDPWHLGQLLALYEHKIFVQGILWGINSFDQWGVELGKKLAVQALEALQGVDNEQKSGILEYIKSRSG